MKTSDSSVSHNYSVKSSTVTDAIVATPTPLENPSAPSSSAPNESRVLSKSHGDFRIEQIENLSPKVTALKSFIIEQLYVIKKSVEHFRSQSATSNNLELIETSKEQIRYLRNGNITKTNFIKFLIDNQATSYT